MSTLELIVFGNASKSIYKTLLIDLSNVDPNLSLMEYCHSHGIPIAASCFGEGLCNKCKVDLDETQGVKSCQINLKDFVSNCSIRCKIVINYL